MAKRNIHEWEDAKAISYISELISLLKYLIANRFITILPKYKYPPEEAEGAMNIVLKQCEQWSENQDVAYF